MTVADFSWWRSWRPEWAEGYCVTLVGDMSPDALLAALGARAGGTVRGADGLDHWVQEHAADGYNPDDAVVGVTALDGWALMTEVNGFVGVTERLMGPLAAGRTIVSTFCNVNAVRRLHWWHDARLLVDVDLLFPAEGFGGEPQALRDDLTALGVPVDGGDEVAQLDLDAVGFALAQRITGVACTPEMFEDSELALGVVTMPSHEEQARYGAALHTTWRAPDTW